MTRGDSLLAGASFNADSRDVDSLNVVRSAALISLSDADSWAASVSSSGRLTIVLPQKRRGGADSVK